MTALEALEMIRWRLSSLNDDLEPRETEKVELQIIENALIELKQLKENNYENNKIQTSSIST